MKNYPFLDLARSNAPLIDELKAAACEVIEGGRYLHGKHTALLEQELADLCQVKYCVAVSNGLDALRLIIRAYREMGMLQADDKVIVPANTYVASVLAVSDNGLVPTLCEPREDTMNLDANCIESLLSPSVRAIMPVHLYGTPCCDEKLLQLARHYNLLVIEDNAQAIGAVSSVPGLNGTKVTGGLGHVGALSFYPTKNLGALGDAGAVVTNDERLATTVRAIANYGSDRRYHNIFLGLNCRIDELQAAMLRVKLRHLAQETERRNAVARAYSQHIAHPQVSTPAWIEGTTQVWHQYVIRVKGDGARDRFRELLQQQGVGTDIHYATPPHLQPCYRQFKSYKLPITTAMANEVVSLPIAHPITPDDAQEIAHIINGINP
jgi:dTDP-4-amino-4,6-dideoxygalactose transaminase